MQSKMFADLSIISCFFGGVEILQDGDDYSKYNTTE
jgi:hypothetical protein